MRRKTRSILDVLDDIDSTTPNGTYGVLYAARDAFGAFIETFGQQTGVRSVGAGELRKRCLTEFYSVRPLSLVDLFSSGCLARIGADSRLFSGSRAIARLWSQAIYAHPDHLKVHGILYPARHNHTRAAVALFDREGLPRLEVNRTVSWYSLEILNRAIAELADEAKIDGREPLFNAVRDFVTGDEVPKRYESIAAGLGVPVGTLKSHVHRFKERYRQLIREQVRDTLARDSDLESELNDLGNML